MSQNPAHRTDEQDGLKILRAAYAYADALAVLRGQPPFSAWDAAKIVATRNQLLAEVVEVAGRREPGPSIPDGAPAPPDLATLIKRFVPASEP
jgi:hypothetical protein